MDLEFEQDQKINLEKILVLSLDYDNCADILFLKNTDVIENAKHEYIDFDLNLLANQFEQYFISQFKNYNQIILIVGSARQSIFIDEIANKYYNNGSCFKNFLTFAEKHNIIFNQFLYTDIHNNIPAGSSIQNPEYKLPNSMMLKLINNQKAFKKIIIQEQLKMLKEAHPDKYIDFHFCDDKIEHLTAINNMFYNDEYVLPLNVTINLHLSSWKDTIKHNTPIAKLVEKINSNNKCIQFSTFVDRQDSNKKNLHEDFIICPCIIL